MKERQSIRRVREGIWGESLDDEVAVEAPLEIAVQGQTVSVTMRTPGRDRELAAGWLASEGIVRRPEEIVEIVLSPGSESSVAGRADVILRDPTGFDVEMHRRNVLTNASCGICGVVTLESVLRKFPKPDLSFRIDARVAQGLGEKLKRNQPLFRATGGVHACALVDSAGELGAVFEDVGRHNAFDKLLGDRFLDGKVPVQDKAALLSGRVSMEMVQKALSAGVQMILAVGAPTSFAVNLAKEAGMTLIAFLHDGGFNVYCGEQRLRTPAT